MNCIKTIFFIIVQLFTFSCFGSNGPVQAEFAVRWESRAPLSNIKDVLKELNIKGKHKISEFTVDYYTISLNENDSKKIPLNSKVIGRVRNDTTEDEIEHTIKFRSECKSSNALDRLSCPLEKVKDEDVKYEVDISFDKALNARRYYSFSCSSGGDVFPKKINATKNSMQNDMTRYKYKSPIVDGIRINREFKIEEWKSTDNGIVIEISMPGLDTAEDFDFFSETIVTKLRKYNSIEPILNNKSDTYTGRNSLETNVDSCVN